MISVRIILQSKKKTQLAKNVGQRVPEEASVARVLAAVVHSHLSIAHGRNPLDAFRNGVNSCNISQNFTEEFGPKFLWRDFLELSTLSKKKSNTRVVFGDWLSSKHTTYLRLFLEAGGSFFFALSMSS